MPLSFLKVTKFSLSWYQVCRRISVTLFSTPSFHRLTPSPLHVPTILPLPHPPFPLPLPLPLPFSLPFPLPLPCSLPFLALSLSLITSPDSSTVSLATSSGRWFCRQPTPQALLSVGRSKTSLHHLAGHITNS